MLQHQFKPRNANMDDDDEEEPEDVMFAINFAKTDINFELTELPSDMQLQIREYKKLT